MATYSSRLYPNRSDEQLGWIYSGLALFTLFAGLITAFAVFANDLYFWWQSPLYISPYLFGLAFVLGASHRVVGLMAIIAMIPLSAGIGQQFNAYLGTSLMTLPNQGLDLASGFFLGAIASYLVKAAIHRKTPQSILSELQYAVPWPIALVIVMVTCSTALAIARNIYQSATATSVKGVLFNLVHFRPIDWHADFMPISDWVAYALAVSMVGVVISYLKGRPNKNQIIFRPLIAGLIVAASMGIVQTITGIGLPESLLVFRKDLLGYAAIGFQPDLHAYAGHMLLGAVGLWGYFHITHLKIERKFLLCAVTLSWIGLVLSKSRSSFLLAFIAMFIWLIFYLWKTKRHLLIPFTLASITLITFLLSMLLNYAHTLNGIPVLSWLGELTSALKSRDLASWSLVSGLFGSRFEIWEGALRMWWEFPLLGVGQGNFYRLSDIASFSKSHYLILNGGENAHNFFIQTLTETGLIGIAIFFLAIFMPLIRSMNKKILLPLIVALVSLFFGNIFAHSFLVRENLLIAAVFIGLLYSQPCYVFSQHFVRRLLNKGSKSYLIPIFFTIFGLIFFMEIYRSYGKFPFVYGFYCYQNKSLTVDGWTKGIFLTPILSGSRGVNLTFATPGAKDDDRPIKMNFQLRHVKKNQYGNNDTINSITQTVKINQNDDVTINIQFSEKNVINELSNIELEVRISSCYSPRNLGDSVDSRFLGMNIKSIQAYQ